MPHPYGALDPANTATATRLAQEVLSRHAADVDVRGRFPEESVAALAGGPRSS